MHTQLDIDELTRQTRRREFDDGLLDFATGGLYLILGLLVAFFTSTTGMQWYLRSLVRHRGITIIGSLALIPLLFLMIHGARKLIERIRYTTLWRESGFVKPLGYQVNWLTSVLAVAAYISLVVGSVWLMARGVLDEEAVLSSLVFAGGISTGIIYFGMGLSLRLNRYIVVGISGGLLSTIILFFSTSFAMSWFLLGLVWSIVLFISGFWALRKAIVVYREGNGE